MPTCWSTTRNTFEAAALAALGVQVRPITGIDHHTGQKVTDWNLAAIATPAHDGDAAWSTGVLRRDTASGALEKLTPLHPYLIGLHAFHNRNRVLDAMKGTSMITEMIVPGLHRLQRGPQPQLPPLTPQIKTADLDLVIALVTCGSQIVSIRKDGDDHEFHVTRFPVGTRCAASDLPVPAFDGHTAMHAYRAGTLWPARRHEPFAIALHALHCLRELRKREHSNQFLIIRHRTPFTKGAALNPNAKGHALGHVQKTLGVSIS